LGSSIGLNQLMEARLTELKEKYRD
jgi:hypothetical protein